MPRYVVIQAVMTSSLANETIYPDTSHGSYGDLKNRWNAISFVSSGAAGFGHWLNSDPRVVRRRTLTSKETSVAGAWVIEDSNNATTAERVNAIMTVVREALWNSFRARIGEEGILGTQAPQFWSGDLSITVTDFNPAINGTLAWWQGPHALSTTRDSFPSTTSALLQGGQSPVGPPLGTQPCGPLDVFEGTPGCGPGVVPSVKGVGEGLAWILIPAAIIVVAVYSKPIIEWIVPKPKSVPLAHNPRRW